MSYVDPEGPDGWIKDPCPYCGAESGVLCRPRSRSVTVAAFYATRGVKERRGPHLAREQAWAARRVREQAEERQAGSS